MNEVSLHLKVCRFLQAHHKSSFPNYGKLKEILTCIGSGTGRVLPSRGRTTTTVYPDFTLPASFPSTSSTLATTSTLPSNLQPSFSVRASSLPPNCGNGNAQQLACNLQPESQSVSAPSLLVSQYSRSTLPPASVNQEAANVMCRRTRRTRRTRSSLSPLCPHVSSSRSSVNRRRKDEAAISQDGPNQPFLEPIPVNAASVIVGLTACLGKLSGELRQVYGPQALRRTEELNPRKEVQKLPEISTLSNQQRARLLVYLRDHPLVVAAIPNEITFRDAFFQELLKQLDPN